jgi:hypothetical protein
MMFSFVQDQVLILRFEDITALKMSIVVFWAATPCGLAGVYQRFGGTYRLMSDQLKCSN